MIQFEKWFEALVENAMIAMVLDFIIRAPACLAISLRLIQGVSRSWASPPYCQYLRLPRLSLICTYRMALSARPSASRLECRRDGVVKGAKSLGKIHGAELAPKLTPPTKECHEFLGDQNGLINLPVRQPSF